MVTAKKEYLNYLTENYTEYKEYKTDLYHNKPYLRFDLQVGDIARQAYYTEVVKRATILFEEVFKPEDEVLIVFKDHKKIRLSYYLFKQIENLSKQEIAFKTKENFYGEGGSYNIAILKIKCVRINYKNIITAISNSDFGDREPQLRNAVGSPSIHFINKTKNIIYNMYDDRGLDIISANIEILRSIYEKFNDWILDYDRTRIDKIFARSS